MDLLCCCGDQKKTPKTLQHQSQSQWSTPTTGVHTVARVLYRKDHTKKNYLAWSYSQWSNLRSSLNVCSFIFCRRSRQKDPQSPFDSVCPSLLVGSRMLTESFKIGSPFFREHIRACTWRSSYTLAQSGSSSLTVCVKTTIEITRVTLKVTWSLRWSRWRPSLMGTSVCEVFRSFRCIVQSLIIPTPIYLYSHYLSFLPLCNKQQ
jgi:hypothetical protein